MANTLTSLAPTLFSAAKQVANEPTGALGAIDMRFDDKGVARGDTVTVDVAPSRTASDFTPSNVTASGTDATAASIGVAITKSRKVDWHLTGEQQRSLENATISEDWVQQLVAQGMRSLRNEAEADAVAAIRIGASRAFGTAGTAPFASDLSALTNARKILQDNGSPLLDLQMVTDTTAGLNLLNLGVVQNAYQAGSETERRTGNLNMQFGFTHSVSGQMAAVTKGTGAAYTTSAAGFAVGATSIPIITGTGTVLVGDVVTFAGDTNKYVVTAGVGAPGTITIAAPGLRVAIAAAATAMTIGGNFTPNLAFERTAVVGIMRPPLMPANANIQQMLVSDSKGMTYLMLDIAQYGQRSWELHLAWGFKAINTEFASIILG